MSLAVALALILAFSLTMYAVFAGADFGAGILDLMSRRSTSERASIARTISPLWEANHVWLIFSITILFSAFPVAFAALGTALLAPLTLALLAIVLRGVAFALRGQPGARARSEARLGALFGRDLVAGVRRAQLSDGPGRDARERLDTDRRLDPCAITAPGRLADDSHRGGQPRRADRHRRRCRDRAHLRASRDVSALCPLCTRLAGGNSMTRLRTLDVQYRLPLAAGSVMLWVAVGPWLWGFAGSRPAVANHVFLVFAFGPLALLIGALRPAALATLAGGVWLAFSPWVLGYATTNAAWVNELVSGVLLIAVCTKAAGAPLPARLRRRSRTAGRAPTAMKRIPSGS